MKTLLTITCLFLAAFIARAQTNVIFPTTIVTNSQSSLCGNHCVGLDEYSGGSFSGYYTWNTASPTHSVSVASNYCVYWFNAGGPHGEAYGTVSPTYVASLPYYKFICYPTNAVNLNTNWPMKMIGFKL